MLLVASTRFPSGDVSAKTMAAAGRRWPWADGWEARPVTEKRLLNEPGRPIDTRGDFLRKYWATKDINEK